MIEIKNYLALPKGLNVVSTVSSAGEIRQVELDLVPALIQTHWHGADEGLHTGGALVVGSSESAAHVLVVEHLHFKGEVLLELKRVRIGKGLHS